MSSCYQRRTTNTTNMADSIHHPTQATSDLDLCGHGSTCTCDMRLTYTRSHLASELIHLAIRVVSSVTTWATVPQVETHVHASASMNVQRSLLDRRGTRSTLRAMTRLKIHRDPEASRSAQATRARSIRSRHAGLATIRPIAQANVCEWRARLLTAIGRGRRLASPWA